MTNNLDDFDQPEMEPNGSLEPPASGVRANLTQAWRTRPLFKLFVVMAVVGALIAVSITLFSSGPATEASHLFKPPRGLSQPPGGSSSPYFIEQTNEATKNREQTAINTGGSALPTPIGSPTNLDETANDKKAKDPLIELRAETDHLKQQLAQVQQQQQQQQQQQPARPPEAFDESLARAMQREMNKLMDGWEPHGMKDVEVTKVSDRGDKTSTAASFAPPGGTAGGPPIEVRALVPAGTVSYAQLLTEANSDVPGPILAQIVSGPLKGARAIGRFEVTSDPYLIMTFTLADLNGKDYPLNAIALDPDTTLGGMATEVDERYFSRVLLPAAAGFMQGFGQALGTGNSSLVTNGTTTIVQQSSHGITQGAFQGVAQAGQTLSQFLQNQANNTKPLVRVAAGTPMGLFFLVSVRDGGNQSYPYGASQPGMPGYNDQSLGASTLNGYNPAMMPTAGYGQTAAPTPMANPVATAGGYNNNTSNLPYPNANMPYNQNLSPAMPNNYGMISNGMPGTSNVGSTMITH